MEWDADHWFLIGKMGQICGFKAASAWMEGQRTVCKGPDGKCPRPGALGFLSWLLHCASLALKGSRSSRK